MKDPIADALGIESTKTVEILPPEPKEEPTDVVKLPDQETDYQLSRETFRGLIKKGNSAIDDMHDIAKQAESPRAYEVLSTMIKTIADVTKDLYGLQKQTKELKEVRGKPTHPDGAINVEKAVFVGTTSDLLKKIKEAKNEIV
jgi:uncharacterized protein Yka (UPF0111/DUF47 family)